MFVLYIMWHPCKPHDKNDNTHEQLYGGGGATTAPPPTASNNQLMRSMCSGWLGTTVRWGGGQWRMRWRTTAAEETRWTAGGKGATTALTTITKNNIQQMSGGKGGWRRRLARSGTRWWRWWTMAKRWRTTVAEETGWAIGGGGGTMALMITKTTINKWAAAEAEDDDSWQEAEHGGGGGGATVVQRRRLRGKVMEAGAGRAGWRGVHYFFFSWRGWILPQSYPLQSCIKIGIFFLNSGVFFVTIGGRIRIGVILWSYLVILPPILPRILPQSYLPKKLLRLRPYCTYDLSWQTGPWKSRISLRSLTDHCRAGQKIRSPTWGIVGWSLLAEVWLIVFYTFYLSLIHLCVK